MNEWDILQIEETTDFTLIRKAYASLIKKYKPHTDPEQFKKIRAAYEKVIEEIQSGFVSDNDNYENSIVQTKEQDCFELVKTIEEPSAFSEKIQCTDTERHYIEHIIELYEDLEMRNNIDVWKTVFQRNSPALLMDDRSFDLILAHIVKSEYLYQSDLPFKPEMYAFLFDFYNVDETYYVSTRYSKYVSRPLLSFLSEFRYDHRLASIKKSEFNLNSPAIQIAAEDYYIQNMLYSSDLSEGNIKKLVEHLRNSAPKYVKVLRNVVFKDILDKYISATTQNDDQLVGLFYDLFRFNNNKKAIFKIFIQMGYNKEIIKNCLVFSSEMHVRHIKPFLYQIIVRIPPIALVCKLICYVYFLIKKFYLVLAPSKKR